MAGYRMAVEWIALNDEPGYLDPEDVERESGMTIALIADMTNKTTFQVAEDVARYRRRRALDSSESTRSDLG